MRRVTKKHTWEHRISAAELRQRISIHPIGYYIFSRQLCWLGTVSRMDFGRLPRRMLSCWVPHKRLVGRPRFTYGQTINKALRKFGFNKNLHGITWQELLVKRRIWKSLLCPSNFYNGISRTDDALTALARVNMPSLIRNTMNTGTKLHPPREPAEYVTVPCMGIG